MSTATSSCYLFVWLADISRDMDNASEQPSSLPVQIAHCFFGWRRCSRFDTSFYCIHYSSLSSSVTAIGKLFQIRMDRICVEIRTLFSSWAWTRYSYFNFWKSFWKLIACRTTSCRASVRAGCLEVSEPHQKFTNKVNWGPMVNPVCLLHLLVCFRLAGKRLTWRQMLFGLCKCWSCLRSEQEDKMINVCKRGSASLKERFPLAKREARCLALASKGPNRARQHVLQTTAALIWEV